MAILTVEQNDIERRVFEIADRLVTDGIKPSNRLILLQLEGITSTSTVHAPFKKWREIKDANKKKFMENLQFSDGLAEAIAEEISRHSSASEKRYRDLAEAADAQSQEVIEDLRAVEDRLHDASVLLEQAKKDKQLLSRKLEAQQQSSEVIVAELRQQLEENSAENKELSKSNEIIRTEIAKAELKLEGNQDYVNEVKGQNVELNSDNKSLHKQLAELNKTIASQEATIIGDNKQIEQFLSSQASLQNSLDLSEQERTTISITAKDLRKELDMTNGALADTKDELAKVSRGTLELQSQMESQSRIFEKSIASNEATISGNEKLISQFEASQTMLESTNSTLSLERDSFAEELSSKVQAITELKLIVHEQASVISNFEKDEK